MGLGTAGGLGRASNRSPFELTNFKEFRLRRSENLVLLKLSVPGSNCLGYSLI
jgi:hypothetical protein